MLQCITIRGLYLSKLLAWTGVNFTAGLPIVRTLQLMVPLMILLVRTRLRRVVRQALYMAVDVYRNRVALTRL